MTDFYKISIDARAERMQRLAIEALKAWSIADCQPQLIKIRENAVFRIKLADGFPADNIGYGFDNIGDVLSMPPLLLLHRIDQRSSPLQ